MQDILDSVFSGKKVDGMTIHDFCDDAWIAPILLAKNRDEERARIDATKKQVEQNIRAWFAGRGADYVTERERAWAEDDAVRYREKD